MRKKKYKHSAAFLAKQAKRKPHYTGGGMISEPAYRVGQRVWHVDKRLPTDAGYFVNSINRTGRLIEYGLCPWLGGQNRNCMEAELTGFAPLGLVTPAAKRDAQCKQIVGNRDLQIGVLKDQLHSLEGQWRAEASAHEKASRELQEAKAKQQHDHDTINALYEEINNLTVKMQGNLGKLVPQLQKERDDVFKAMANKDDQLRRLEIMRGKLASKVARLRRMIDLFLEGELDV
jgi:hypothetical protein